MFLQQLFERQIVPSGSEQQRTFGSTVHDMISMTVEQISSPSRHACLAANEVPMSQRVRIKPDPNVLYR